MYTSLRVCGTKSNDLAIVQPSLENRILKQKRILGWYGVADKMLHALVYEPTGAVQLTITCTPHHISVFYPMRAEDFFVRFEVFTAVTMKNAVFWNVTSCGSCKNRRFLGTYRLHYQGDKNGRTRNNVRSN
jgi:hypothetical protein